MDQKKFADAVVVRFGKGPTSSKKPDDEKDDAPEGDDESDGEAAKKEKARALLAAQRKGDLVAIYDAVRSICDDDY